MTALDGVWSDSPIQQGSRVLASLLVVFFMFHNFFGQVGREFSHFVWVPLLAILAMALYDMYKSESGENVLYLFGYVVTTFVICTFLRLVINDSIIVGKSEEPIKSSEHYEGELERLYPKLVAEPNRRAKAQVMMSIQTAQRKLRDAYMKENELMSTQEAEKLVKAAISKATKGRRVVRRRFFPQSPGFPRFKRGNQAQVKEKQD